MEIPTQASTGERDRLRLPVLHTNARSTEQKAIKARQTAPEEKEIDHHVRSSDEKPIGTQPPVVKADVLEVLDFILATLPDSKEKEKISKIAESIFSDGNE